MERLNFSKLDGAGNDFVFVEDLDDAIDLAPEQVQALCDRHFGIGADGVIVVKPPEKAENAGFMHYINADGSIAEMCGNGIRCFAKYIVDHRIAADSNDRIVIETRAGEKTVQVEKDENGLVTSVRVDMGKPALVSGDIPTILAPNAVAYNGEPFVCDAPIDSPYGMFAFTCVSMGNPHAICFIEKWDELDDGLFSNPERKSLDTFDISKVGSYYESCSAFPEKANIEFATKTKSGIAMRVFERGCGETLACGTGACATAVAGFLRSTSPSTVTVHVRGGDLLIEYDTDANRVFMTGPAEETFAGSVLLGDCGIMQA